MSIKHEFVEPDYVYLGFEGVINYNPKLTALKASDITTLVTAGIEDYFDNELGTLDRTFFLSKFSERVKEVNPSIVSSVFKMRLQKRIPIGISTRAGYSAQLNYLTAIDPETIRSSNFVTTISGIRHTGFLQDFSDDAISSDSGTGTIKFIDKTTNTVVATVGTVNYMEGVITLSNVVVTEYLGNVAELYLSLRPQPLYQNITSSVVRTTDNSLFAVAAQPSRSTILTLDDSVSNSDANILAGVVISSRPYTTV
jgi:hypothetical protein